MKILLRVELPAGPFNAAVRDGSIGPKIQSILDDAKPETIYFTELNGHRGAIMIVDVETPSSVPKLAEPWFLQFDATIEFHVAMAPEELKQTGLDELGKNGADPFYAEPHPPTVHRTFQQESTTTSPEYLCNYIST